MMQRGLSLAVEGEIFFRNPIRGRTHDPKTGGLDERIP
jgi:hypothetical protein